MLKLKELRERMGISQRELARRLCVSHATYNSWELGKRDPDTATIKALAEFFGVTTDYLLGNEKIKSEVSDDDELAEILEELRTRPEVKMMFSLTKRATKADIIKAVKIVETLLAEEEDE